MSCLHDAGLLLLSLCCEDVDVDLLLQLALGEGGEAAVQPVALQQQRGSLLQLQPARGHFSVQPPGATLFTAVILP